MPFQFSAYNSVSTVVRSMTVFFLKLKPYKSIIVSATLYLPQSLSMRSRFFSSSSANFALDLTPSPDFCDFSTMPHALSTNDGTVSCFSCFGISTRVQYCVSNRITSCKRENNIIKKKKKNDFRKSNYN